ncbi:sensor histidine kinase [Enterococcus ratti]|uniref:cache domain-containing sensor histidine kinase n=1 Tax=Enterococcus ratti TaxID=150033 RepID=UPI0035113771
MRLQSILMLIFSILSVVTTIIIGWLLYTRFSLLVQEKEVEASQALMRQTRDSVESYLQQMRQLSNMVYYNIVIENDFSTQSQVIQNEMNLLYENNKENLASLAIYNHDGSLIAAEPVALQKEDSEITNQRWFQEALGKMEHIHFSSPHIQNLFDNGSMNYNWVISLSRVVELNKGGETSLGVLLVDMNYCRISHIMEQLNLSNHLKYYYLCDNQGKIIYHPKKVQINKGFVKEETLATKYKEGDYTNFFKGEKRTVLVNDISYTGWKLIGVIPKETFLQDRFHVGSVLAIYIVLMVMVLLVINRLIALKVSSPLRKLNESVIEYESGKKPAIYIGGSNEIRHLGRSIQVSYEQNEALMKKVILEHNERRKSELAALQSQINPHFLYNTLESITWMIEGERNDKAVFMVTQLAKLFRISLSKGKPVISIADELQHAKSYINIQKERYQERVMVNFAIDPKIEDYAIVKLVLQPILENSLNYAADCLNEGGEIDVSGQMIDNEIHLCVKDKGIGMAPEQLAVLLTDDEKSAKMGSGVGLKNVNNRLQLFFGKKYGIRIKSQLDEGTTVTIVIPAVKYTKGNSSRLEQGEYFDGRRNHSHF